MEVQKSQKGADDIIMKRKIYQQLLDWKEKMVMAYLSVGCAGCSPMMLSSLEHAVNTVADAMSSVTIERMFFFIVMSSLFPWCHLPQYHSHCGWPLYFLPEYGIAVAT